MPACMAAPDDALHPGAFAQIERFAHAVVRADLEPGDAIRDLGGRRDDDDAHVVAFAQEPREREPVRLGD